MFTHLLKIIRNNLRANLLLMAGLFIISTALWYAVDYVYTVAVNRQTPLGFDWHHTYYVGVGVLPAESAERDTARHTNGEATADYLEFFRRVKAHSAVQTGCYTQMHMHYVWKNAMHSYSKDSVKVWAYTRWVSPEYFETFGVKGADGCPPAELTHRAERPGGLVMCEKTAFDLANDRKANVASPRSASEMVGTEVGMDDDKSKGTVLAVCEIQKYNEYTSQQRAVYEIVNPGKDGGEWNYESIPYYDMFIRVKPEADDAGFADRFRDEMKKQLRVGNLYLGEVKPMSVYRDMHLAEYRNDLYMYLGVAGFFLVNAFLAVLGTFWFRTQQRREELAIRLVSGATPRSLQALLLGEGFLLMTFAYIPALVMAYNLGVSDLVSTWPVPWSFTRFLAGGLIAYLLLALITAFSIWFPARQAMKIEAAEALHGE